MILLSLLAAIIPTILYVTLLWWLDKYEKEPWGLFLAAFAYGFLPAIVLAIIFELLLDIPLSGIGGTGEAIGMGVVAPVVEEIVKGLAVLAIFFIWRREFDGVLDGIIYGAVVGLGFAMTENFFYFISSGGDAAVILLRSLPFGLNHAFFTAFTGASLGVARLSRRRGRWLLLFPLGLILAIGFHAAHNLLVSTASVPGCLGALISNTIGLITILVVAILSWGHEKRWIRQELGEEVTTGLLAQADYYALLLLSRRVGARLWIWRHHGWRAFRLLGRFFTLATELAFYKHHLREGTVRQPTPEQVETLRQQVREARGALLQIIGGTQ